MSILLLSRSLGVGVLLAGIIGLAVALGLRLAALTTQRPAEILRDWLYRWHPG